MDMMRFPVRLLWLICLTTILAPCLGTAMAGNVSQDDAVAITTDTLLGGTMEGKRLFVLPQLVQSGAEIADWKNKSLITAPATGWFVFIDQFPGANWEHPCTYVFVDENSGELISRDAMAPPARQGELSELTDGRDNPSPEANAKAHAWFDEAIQRVPKPAPDTRGMAWAIIISGGANQGNNHIRYWNDSSFIYKTLINYYGYNEDQIYVLISDGTNPAADRSDGTNSPADLDGDGDDDTMYPATLAYVDQAFAELATELSASDQLFIYTTDHGGSTSGWDVYLNLWNLEELSDDHLAELVDALPCETIIGCFEQCFSGGMTDDLEAEGRVIATAASYDEYSWAMGPDYIYDTFVYHWTSAVNWARPDGTPVNADTNGDTMISMKEAFDFAVANDHEEETPTYSSTPADLGEVLNLFGSLDGVYLALDSMVIDDDNLGASSGNGNGIIEFGETIELDVTLSNLGLSGATGVVGTAGVESGFVTVVNGIVSFGDIGPESSAAGDAPFVLQIRSDIPDNEELGFTIALTDDPTSLDVDLVARAPGYMIGILDIDDVAGGNGDGIPNPGETVTFSLGITNTGGTDTPYLSGLLDSSTGYFDPDGTPRALGVIATGAYQLETGFTVTINPACPDVHSHYLVLQLDGPAPYRVYLPFGFHVGQAFADQMEQGSASWTHYVGSGTFVDQWHLSTDRNHTPGGTDSWCHGESGGQYANLSYGVLQTALFDLPANSSLSFWHWIDAEVSGAYPDYCYDGGLLEISLDGGTSWSSLTPPGGYPYLVRVGGTPGPFAADTPVWSGSSDWSLVTIDLGDLASSEASLRWAFGSDGSAVGEGWYVDDVLISSALPSDSPDNGAADFHPILFAIGPNPVTMSDSPAGDGLVTIRYALPSEGQVNLSLYDTTGRLVRELASGAVPAGPHQIGWDGLDSHGTPVVSGTYYVRLLIDQEEKINRLTIIR